MKTRTPRIRAAPGSQGTRNPLPQRPWHLRALPARRPRTPAQGLWTQIRSSPSSWEMPSTDLWGILHSCRDLVRSEKRLLGTSIVSTQQCW